MKRASPSPNYFYDILRNRVLLFCAVFVTVLCYGFAITHFSVGVDDVARNFYFYSQESGNLIQQGRLLHLLLNYLTRSIDWIPFFTEFVGASLYCLSALLFCGLLQTVGEGKLSTASLAAFTVVYLSTSINVEKFLYHLDVIAIMTSYCACALGLLYAYRFVSHKASTSAVPAVLLTICAIASYESFIFLYVCSVFAILILEILKNPEKNTFFSLLRSGLRYALILFAAIVLYYSCVVVVQHITMQLHTFTRGTVWNTSDKGLLDTFIVVCRNIVQSFRNSLEVHYRPIWTFLVVSCMGGLLAIILAFRRKNWWLLPCFVALFLSNFCIHIIFGSFHPRFAQTFCLYLGFLILLGVAFTERLHMTKPIAICLVSLLVFVQAADMNR